MTQTFCVMYWPSLCALDSQLSTDRTGHEQQSCDPDGGWVVQLHDTRWESALRSCIFLCAVISDTSGMQQTHRVHAAYMARCTAAPYS